MFKIYLYIHGKVNINLISKCLFVVGIKAKEGKVKGYDAHIMVGLTIDFISAFFTTEHVCI